MQAPTNQAGINTMAQSKRGNGQNRKSQSQQKGRRDRRSRDDNAALHTQADIDIAAHAAAQAVKARDTSPIVGKNPNQKRYIRSIGQQLITIANGPAGVGKTWLVAALAAEMLEAKEIDKIILTRPAQEAGEKLGFLPGEKEEKYEPYLQPFREALEERLGKSTLEYYLKVGKIEGAPLAYMRGRTFKNALVILDEAQNTTPTQMKMFLTRAGEGTRMVINGDLAQKDIYGESGLAVAMKKLQNVAGVVTIDFTVGDVVRSGIVQAVLEAWEATEDKGTVIGDIRVTIDATQAAEMVQKAIDDVKRNNPVLIGDPDSHSVLRGQ